MPPAKATAIQTRWEDVRELVDRLPEAMRSPRTLARILSGLSSPALSRAHVGRDRLFGELEGHPFAQVITWCQEHWTSVGLE